MTDKPKCEHWEVHLAPDVSNGWICNNCAAPFVPSDVLEEALAFIGGTRSWVTEDYDIAGPRPDDADRLVRRIEEVLGK